MMIKVHRTNEDFQFNSDKENWASARTYANFASQASRLYTVLIDADKDKTEQVLKDYIGSGLVLITYSPYMSVALMLSEWEAEDISEELTVAGIEHCVYKQTLTIA